MKSEEKFEESLNYTGLLMLQLNDIRMAIQSGKTGSIELENLYMFIASPIMQTINEDINKINDMYAKEEGKLLKLWEVQIGHPSNNKFRVEMTLNRHLELNRLRALANQLIVNKIIDALYKHDMLLTKTVKMPTSLVS